MSATFGEYFRKIFIILFKPYWMSIIDYIKGMKIFRAPNNHIYFLFLLINWIAALSIVMVSFQGIFVAVPYQYATTGTVPQAFDTDLIKGAFKQEIKGSII